MRKVELSFIVRLLKASPRNCLCAKWSTSRQDTQFPANLLQSFGNLEDKVENVNNIDIYYLQIYHFSQ